MQRYSLIFFENPSILNFFCNLRVCLVKQLAIEWASDGVLINTIFPSMVETPMLRENVASSIIESIESTIPLGRIAQPNEIALIMRIQDYFSHCRE